MALAITSAITAPAFGQGEETPTFHPFAFGFNGGGSATPDTKIYDLRIPASFKIFTADNDDWGLRLRLVLYAGVYDFTVEEAVDLGGGYVLIFGCAAGDVGIVAIFKVS